MKNIIIEEFHKRGITDYEVMHMDSVTSTNTFAMDNAVDDGFWKNEKVIIIAEEQTAGKGRLGRSFESDRGKGIYATLVIRPDKNTYEIANITLVIALAVARAFDRIGVRGTQIKWPNDIILNGKKLCGILTEMKNDRDKVKFVAIGFGINVDNDSFPKQISDKATSVYMEIGEYIDRKLILSAIIEEFEKLYFEYLSHKDLSFMKDEYNERLINRGCEVIVELACKKQTATQLGIDENGILKVLLDGEEKSITSGEVLVRGVLGYV